METLKYILDKFELKYDDNTRMPLEIPNFGRNNLANLFTELGFTRGVEIGVEKGEYSEVLLEANPGLFLDSIDAWKAYRGYRDHTRQAKLDAFYEETKQRLERFNKRVEIIKGFSMFKVEHYQDNSLDFVYIDGNHNFVNVAQDIHYWGRKVKPGGIISGHDYVKHPKGVDIHVVQVVNAYTSAYRIKPWFVLGTNAEKKGEIRDKNRSWMWVKE